jgi:hypothetical protein
LLDFLYQKGIFAVGTIRRNRSPNCKIPDEKTLKKEKRGTSVEYISSYKSSPISVVIWKDNKYVTYYGETPKSNIKRFDRKEKNMLMLNVPS